MENNKKSVPASVRIAFVIFLALGFIIIGALWMQVNEMREQNEKLRAKVNEYAEDNARVKELIEAITDEDYARRILREYGYFDPTAEYFPSEVAP